jgi:hypothetical protein
MARPKLSPDEIRYRRDIWLSVAEWQHVVDSAAAAGIPTRAYARRVLSGRHVSPAPTVSDRVAWVELARVHSNLNQIAATLNAAAKSADFSGIDLASISALLSECNAQTRALRAQILGADQ